MNDLPQINADEANNPNPPIDNTVGETGGVVENKRKTAEKDMTMKQKLWLKKYIECHNATEAAIQVYDCKGDREVAASIGWENLRKLDFGDLMEEAGITDEKLNSVLDDGLGSTKQIGARKIVQGARVGHEIKVDANTDTDDFIDVPDYAVRHKYLETALKLKKRLTDKNDINMDVKISNITITREPMKDGSNG